MSSYETLKEYIKSSLKDEEVVKKISHMRTHFTHIMSEFYFFNIFFRTLKSLGVDCSRSDENSTIIDFHKDGVKYTIDYNRDKLLEDIKEFNELQSDGTVDMSMLGSAHLLIGIFISLLI